MIMLLLASEKGLVSQLLVQLLGTEYQYSLLDLK